ncbi:expressed unknown protein [Seminavis robusta]|uniref:SET domain-containing protein n=1 Tax=Seminavis robusta TaxID=568900 RepID=A0A9N8H888_9STRA|nr:expressed unknown protein [Seminavis robusta]|eukprot:Sro231_g093500.1 n/a (237) ;mRNA; f:1952-2662
MMMTGSLKGDQRTKCLIPEWKYPNCASQANEILSHIPTPEDWVLYREAYRRSVMDTAPEHFSLEPSTWANGSATGFQVPIRVQYSPDDGRGIYAITDIPNNTLVWDNRFTARIRNECEARQFVLQELTAHQACNVILWGYAFDHGTGQLEWGIDLDPGTFLNKAPSSAEINVEDRLVDRSLALEPGGHSMWSTRDIRAGEELLSAYQDVHSCNPFKNLWWEVKLVWKSWGISAVMF